MNREKVLVISNLLEEGKAAEAKEAFDKITPENTADYWLLKGKLEQKFQNWGQALNAFSKVLEIDKENVEAQNNIQIIRNILNFWNPEMFNP